MPPSTALTASHPPCSSPPHQNHEAIRATAQAMGARYGVEFLDRDFRPLFQAGQEFAREHCFYMQKYCGCIFSEDGTAIWAAKRKKAARPGGSGRRLIPRPALLRPSPVPQNRKTRACSL